MLHKLKRGRMGTLFRMTSRIPPRDDAGVKNDIASRKPVSYYFMLSLEPYMQVEAFDVGLASKSG